MDVARISVAEAKRRLDEGHVYLDVRTPEEFAAGHPPGARNVPYMLRADGRMVKNEAFSSVVRAVCTATTPLVVGCATGQRSLMAAKVLLDAGFTEVTEMRAGYAGIRDPFGQVTEPGWATSGLPTELSTPGGSYAELLELVEARGESAS